MAHRFSAHEAAQQGGKSFYAGVVRLRFESFAASPKYLARELSIKNIERLKTIFRTDGVLSRENPLNRIPILLTATALTSALEKAGIGKDDINGDPPYHQLPMPKGSVQYLHGHHRLMAAKDIIPQMDRWWGVDIYIEEFASDEDLYYLQHQYANSANITDGEIFRNIRLSSRENDLFKQQFWWSRLSRSKSRDLKQLLRSARFRVGFDKLLDIPGLWPAVQLGALHKLLPLKCDEEVARYLDWVSVAWGELAGANHLLVDRELADTMELRAPAISDVDRDVLTRLCDVPHNGGKDAIYENIRRANDRIPTLHSLFQDLKYLEAVAGPMKLLAGPTKLTVRQSFERMFVGDQHAFEESYWELWLFSMINFHKLSTAITLRKNANRPKPICEQNLHILAEFARIADELGFSSGQIDKYIESTPEIIVAREFFSKFRPRDVYVYDNGVFEEEIRNLSESLCRFQKRAPSTRKPALTGENPVEVTRRTGRPFENDHERDADNYTLENMLGPLPLERDNDITTFFCRRSWFIAFFVGGGSIFEQRVFDLSRRSQSTPQDPDLPPPSEAESPLSVEGQPPPAPEGHPPPTHEAESTPPPPPPPEGQSPPPLSPGPGRSRRRPRSSSDGANKKRRVGLGPHDDTEWTISVYYHTAPLVLVKEVIRRCALNDLICSLIDWEARVFEDDHSGQLVPAGDIGDALYRLHPDIHVCVMEENGELIS